MANCKSDQDENDLQSGSKFENVLDGYSTGGNEFSSEDFNLVNIY